MHNPVVMAMTVMAAKVAMAVGLEWVVFLDP